MSAWHWLLAHPPAYFAFLVLVVAPTGWAISALLIRRSGR